MDKTKNMVPKQQQLRTEYEQYFDLIEGAVCFVLANETEEIVFANEKAASLFECEDVDTFLQFCSSKYQNLMEEKDYKPLSEIACVNPAHFTLSFHYQTQKGHFRKAVGVGTLKETSFGKTFVILLFPSEQITNDLQTKDKTGVLGMHDFFQEALQQAEKRKSFLEVRAFCPVSFDLTSFKEYNRQYGMQQGDLCLKKIADAITRCFPNALVGHLTADHFVALLPSDDLETKLEQVCKEINSFINDDGIQLKVGIYKPTEKDSIETLRHAFDLAKIACDSIKTDGNRSIAIYRSSLGKTLAKKTYILRHFGEALEKHYIKVYFQPVIRTLTGKLSGYEALARWEDPVQGMIFPDVFIPVLEDAQLINRLDRYVLEQVCRVIRDRMDNGLPLLPVSMNLSAYDFDVANPLDTIEKMVKRYQIPRTLLCFEITERVMFQNKMIMSKVVFQFQQAGYQVWMDDFGSEYSSLNTLHNYHFDVIKIDMGFFSHFDDRSRQIITSVVTMARMLGVQTLAEGVETKGQVSFLKKIGCGRIQGYYYGKPMRYDDTFTFNHGRGLQFEQSEEAHLMDAAESVNVISDSPTALFRFDGTNIELLIENDAYKRELRSTGTQGMDEANAYLMDSSYPFRGRFQQLLIKALHSRSQETLTYADNGQYMRVSVRWIAGDEEHWIGEAHIYNISNNEAIQQAKTLDNTLRDIFQFYEGFYVMERGKGEVKILRSNHPELNPEPVQSIEDFLAYFSETLVYPDDRARFAAFIDPANIETKTKSEGVVQTELLRIRKADGTFRWTVFETLMIYKSATKNILLCEREDIWECKRDRNTLLPIFCQSFGISTTDTIQLETRIESSLFRVLCETSPYLFYWKDQKGRILGASKSLQTMEDFHDTSDFIGKSEEEIGFSFPLLDKHSDKEKKPHLGNPTTQVEELMLTVGRFKPVQISRIPWYLDKEFAGTLGMVHKTSSDKKNDELHLGLVDKETDVLSFRGAIEAGLLYADRYRIEKLDYVGLLIDVPMYAELMRDNSENAKVILEKLTETLREELTPGWAIARIGICCFLCFSQREKAEQIEEKLTTISGIFPSLCRKLGIQINLLMTHAIVYGSEVMSLDEMFQLLIRRLHSAEKEAYGERTYTEDRIYVRRELLDDLPERVIISDPKTFELVYMNQAARDDVGLDRECSLKGCFCYQTLEGYDGPCKNCPNLMLRMDRALSLSHMNHKTGDNLIIRSFLTIWEKRTLKVTFAFNINEYLDTLAGDREMFYQEMRANEAISRGMEEEDPEKGIEMTMSSIAEYMQPERFLIFEERDDNTVSATYEWTKPGVIPLKEELQSIPRTELRALYTRFVSERLVMVHDMKAFQKEYPDFKLRMHGLQSFISGQLLLQNQTEGFTMVVNPSEESFRRGSVIYSTLTDFIAVMVRNRNSIRELERQSTIDLLTGAGNRRALEQRIRTWQGDGILGVISIDLNGLKNTNDTKGHHAGDMLIRESARILMECAGEDCVFRTGGDEFVVVTEDLEQRDILLLIRHMRDSATINGISMAIGYAYIRGKVTDFDALLTKADLNMYQDKGHSFRRRREDR